jgi:paraquat-inducible protein A
MSQALDSHDTLPNVPDNWRDCARCGLISALPEAERDHVAVCPRCHHALWRQREHPFEFAIACGLSGVIFYCLAVGAPFLEITALGRAQLAVIESGPEQLLQQGLGLVGLLVLAVTVIFPGIKLVLMLVTLIGLRSGLLAVTLLKPLFRWYGHVTPWAMIDVYLLGFLVAYTKLSGLAQVHLDTALYALIGLMVSLAAADAALDSEAVWRALDQTGTPAAPVALPPPAGARLIGCHCCAQVNVAEPGTRCRRCNAVLHPRKTNSITRSWALLLAAVLLYIPSNINPIMIYTQLGVSTPYTIMTGIIELIDSHLLPMALLVFFASITIPLAKLVTLGYLLIQTQIGSRKHLLGRTWAFNAILFIGRWSMIDVFMISILVALLRFGEFTNVQAQIGIMCFAGVVVLTMFAVDGFDPKLMWDALEQETHAAADDRQAAGIQA